MTTEIAVITCRRCHRTIYVYQGPKGPEAMCIDCGVIVFVRQQDIRWGVPIFDAPKGAIMREAAHN